MFMTNHLFSMVLFILVLIFLFSDFCFFHLFFVFLQLGTRDLANRDFFCVCASRFLFGRRARPLVGGRCYASLNN